MIEALLIFIIAYILLLIIPKYRAYIALATAALFVILGILPGSDIFRVVNWNVILMIAGMMGIVHLFIESKMPAYLADILMVKMPNVRWAIIALALFAGLISAFVDNVATVLMVAPIALTISKKLGLSPVRSIIIISIAANLQGAATLVGDTAALLYGGYAGVDFLDFFAYQGHPGIFWVVQLGALAATIVLIYLLRHDRQRIPSCAKTAVHDYLPSCLMVGVILLLIIASCWPNKPAICNGLICVSALVIGLFVQLAKTKSWRRALQTLRSIDYFTLLLLVGLFIMVAAITKAGVVSAIAELFVRISHDNPFVIYTLVVWSSVLFTAFIDSVPYVAAMLPVAANIASLTGIDPTILYWGLLTGATLGGNLTPIGASANITGMGILRQQGYQVSLSQFMRISVPLTLAAVLTGYAAIWLIFSI
jgi:Na+/H+ antiporter NhaD/arsenite permease-like protein